MSEKKLTLFILKMFKNSWELPGPETTKNNTSRKRNFPVNKKIISKSKHISKYVQILIKITYFNFWCLILLHFIWSYSIFFCTYIYLVESRFRAYVFKGMNSSAHLEGVVFISLVSDHTIFINEVEIHIMKNIISHHLLHFQISHYPNSTQLLALVMIRIFFLKIHLWLFFNYTIARRNGNLESSSRMGWGIYGSWKIKRKHEI